MMNLIDISKKLSNSQLTEIININNLNKESDIFLKINKQKLEDYEKKRINSKEYLNTINDKIRKFNSTRFFKKKDSEKLEKRLPWGAN